MNYIERFNDLTDRECEVLDLYCQGLTYERIGEQLFIARQSVKSHMHHIYVKLGLIDQPPRSRAFTLQEEYWPLVKSRLKKINVSQPEEIKSEPEIIEPIPADVEEMIEQDQANMKALVVAGPVQLTPPPKPPRPRRRLSCFSLLLILLIAGAAAFWYFDGLSVVQDVLASVNASPTQDANDPNEAASGFSPTLRPTTAPTKAPTATRIPTKTATLLPTKTLNPKPSPTYDLGSVYNLEEWHKEGDLWIRLTAYDLENNGWIYFLMEVWNQTSDQIHFSWISAQNYSLRDNLGNVYSEARTDIMYDQFSITLEPGDFEKVARSGVGYTVWYDGEDTILSRDVTELYFTITDLSRFDRATWVIYLAK